MKEKEFEALYQETIVQKEKLSHKNNIISLIRFLLMVICIVFLLVGYFQKIYVFYFLSLFSFVSFLLLVQYHDTLKQHLLYYQSLQQVYEEHLYRIQNKWNAFLCDGEEWLDDHDYKSYDLDIFSQHSLFQMINVASTYQGKCLLAKILKDDDVSYEEVIHRQNAVEELSQHEDFVLKMQTLGKMIPSQKEKSIQSFLFIKNENSLMSSFIFVVSILTILSLIGMIIHFGSPYNQVVFEVGVVFQLCFSLCYLKQHQSLFSPIVKLEKSLSQYKEMFILIQKEKFHCQELKDIQKRIVSQTNAIKGIEKLSILSQRVHYRQNIFAYILLNALIMFDFIIRNQYIQWLQEYQSSMNDWFQSLSEIEAYMSLCILKIDDYPVTMPHIHQEQVLYFKNLRHPLIPLDKAVGNDFQLNHQTCIITGSNMSGKTTFMRTVGLNLVLAYAGGYVFADEMHCSLMHIMTSMRVKDNVEEGISTFYGELLRIKEMISYAQNKKPMLCLIDEIFKGTNSLDRIAGAHATIEKLSLPYIYLFLTTHDLELCHHSSIDIDLYHFDEYYENNQIQFDYLIKKGISHTTNGKFLLKQLGIIDD